MRKPIVVLLLLVLVLIFGCESGDDPNPLIPSPPEPPVFEPDDPDPVGNLVIRNMSNQVIVLYARGERTKVLPASSDDFLVNIPNQSGSAADLWIFKVADLENDPDHPDLAHVFKRWSVVLSSDNEIEHHVTWLVRASDAESISGTLLLNYMGGVDESVDVMLNSRTGAKLASLRPGQQEKRVGLDYGNYVILYRYWISDQNSPDGEEELGWVEIETVNGEEVAIYLILNDSRNERHIQVPHWNNGNIPETQYGNIRIKNDTAQPVQIWVGSDLIEDVMYTDEPIQNRSTIAANDIELYTMPVIETEYTFIAKYLANGTELSRRNISIVPDSTIYWEITTRPPAKVTDLSGMAATSSRIDLAWQISTTNELGFYIERSGDGSDWQRLDEVGARILSYFDNTITGNATYWYRIIAYNDIGNASPSDPVTVATLTGPSALQASAPSMTEVELTWTDNADGETGFMIERWDENSNWIELGIRVGANEERYFDTGLTPGMNYCYQIRAFNSDGYSDYSNEAPVTTPGPPAPPTNPSIEILSPTELKVSWTDNSGNEDGFEVERKIEEDGEWFQIATVGVNVESYTDSSLSRNTTYFYRIRAFNQVGGYSDYSEEASATTPDEPPSAPANLTAQALSAYEINLTWEDLSDNEDGFQLQCIAGSGNIWDVVADIPADSTGYQDRGLIPNTAYSYRLRAYNSTGYSDYTNVAGTSTPDSAPLEPADLQAIGISSIQIDLSWVDNSLNETGFTIERSTDNQNWGIIGGTSADVTEYQDNPLQPNTLYYYRVFAYNGVGNSIISNVAFARTRYAGIVAFVADGDAGLQVVDVTIPQSPQIIGAINTNGVAQGVDISGDYAYIADGYGGVQVVDITRPDDPRIIRTIDMPDEAVDITISGELAFVADKDAGVRILNLADPENPVEIGFYDTPGWAWDVAVQDNYAYVADRHSGFRIIDVSNPRSSFETGVIDTVGIAYGIAVSGDYAFISAGVVYEGNPIGGLRIINISDPNNPFIVNTRFVEVEGRDVVLIGDLAYTTMGSNVVGFNVSDPNNPGEGEWVMRGGSFINGLAAFGNYIYIACVSGLQIADVNNIPVPTGFIDTPGYAVNAKVVEYR